MGTTISSFAENTKNITTENFSYENVFTEDMIEFILQTRGTDLFQIDPEIIKYCEELKKGCSPPPPQLSESSKNMFKIISSMLEVGKIQGKN